MSQHQGLSDQVLVTADVQPQSLSGAVNGAGVDTAGWEGCAFVFNIGAITGLGTFDARVQQADNASFTNATNVANASITQVLAASNNNVAIVDVNSRNTQRYLRSVVTQATNTVLGGANAVRYRRNGVLPPTQAAIQVVKV